MTDFTPMSDSRREQLLKAASDVIDMIGMTVDPDAALEKAAADYSMNEHEIDLVSHAANNSLAYDHITTESEDARGAPFPVTNAETVRSRLYPDKEKDVDEDPVAWHAPDALDTSRAQKKKAADSSYVLEQNFNLPQMPDPVEVLECAFAVEGMAKEATAYQEPELLSPLEKVRHQLDDLRMKVAHATDEVYRRIDRLRDHYSLMMPADFTTVKQAAASEGISGDLIALVAKAIEEDPEIGQLPETIGVDPKTASVLSVVKELDQLVKQASDAQAEHDRIYGEAMEKEAASYDPAKGLATAISSTRDLTIGEDFDEKIQQIAGQRDEKPPFERFRRYDSDRAFDQSASVRDRFNDIKNDSFVRGHDLGSIAEAFNAGLAGGFGSNRAKLLSFVRQYLASDANMPIDLLVRADTERRGEKATPDPLEEDDE